MSKDRGGGGGEAGTGCREMGAGNPASRGEEREETASLSVRITSHALKSIDCTVCGILSNPLWVSL